MDFTDLGAVEVIWWEEGLVEGEESSLIPVLLA